MAQTNTTDGATRVAIVANGKHQGRRVASKLFATFKEDKRFYLSKKDPDVVISISGDGVLLPAFHICEKNLDKMRSVGVHTEHLNFYTDYRGLEVERLIESLHADKGRKVSYPILRIEITLDDGHVVKARALNEVTIKRVEKTMVAGVVIDKVKLERFRGDGLSVSTPTGNTGHNKPLDGTILHSTMKALQLAEISSLNSRIYRTLGSSVVAPKKDKIEIILKRQSIYTTSIDNKTIHYRNMPKIEYCIDNKRISFVATPFRTNFWERVADAFIGELRS